MLSEQVRVEVFPSIEDGVEAEAVRGKLPGLFADGTVVLRRNLHHPGHGGGQRQEVSRLGEESGLAVDEGLAGSGYVGGNGGQGAGSGLEKPHGKAFPQGRLNKGVGSLHPRADVGLKTQQADAALQAEFAGQAAQLAFQRAGAGDDEARLAGHLNHRAEQRRVVLDWFQASGGEPEKLVFEAELPPNGITDRRIGTPQLDIDAVGEHVEFFLAYHANGEMRFGGGQADGGDCVG